MGVVGGPLVLALWLGGGGNAAAAFAATTTVRPGDTLSAIALRYHTTVAALAAANDIADPNRILAGATIEVPAPAPAAAVAPVAATTPPLAAADSPAATTVVVRAGDTLSAIALRNHTTVAALAAANDIADPDLVWAGARLKVPGAGLPPGWGPGGPLPASLLAHPDRVALRPDFLNAAGASSVAPSLLEALCWWESGWQSSSTSSTGAIGLCQLEPSTVNYVRTVLLDDPALDPRAAPDNITMAAAYLHDLTVRAGGDVRIALAAYYQGLSSVRQKGLLPSTRTYVTGILGYAAIFAAAG
ncbi:MAG TPA: LysM peptidoglycan-binding domain-containing protein [Acidimicrobiales bacterium]|nr:LysM peptidoglycan-binding domain-containing protein [Acidimicrobiales bacterium]